MKAFSFISNLLNTIIIFTADAKTCFTEKNVKIKKFNKEQKELNKTQVAEITPPSGSKFLCLTPKFYKL